VNDAGWVIPDAPLLHAIGTDSIACGIAARGTLYPDHVVFLGERAAIADESHPLSRVIADAAANDRNPPVYAVVPGAGVLLSPALIEGARAMLGCLAQVGLRSSTAEALNYLDIDDVAALIGWEAEAYRLARNHIDATAGT
jgi:rhamnose utilization protein RhaD (predicted bifunctional aldolase and dehydrogenase)